QPLLFAQAQPVVIGDIPWLKRSAHKFGYTGAIEAVTSLTNWPASSPTILPCIQGTRQDLHSVIPGQAQAPAGQAAYDFLKLAIEKTQSHEADGIVTLPLHKEGLHLAGLHYPGHTEILAEACGVKKFAMMLYAPLDRQADDQRGGVGVAHVTLHQSLK